MRDTTGLFEQMVTFDTIHDAVDRTTRGKRRRRSVARFLVDRDVEVARLQRALCEGTWCPEEFTLLRIRDPKPRVIARAPVRDRVVHTLCADLLSEVFGRSLSSADFACRPGFGQHRAVLALGALMRRHRFALHLDIRAYYPSIAPDTLLGLIERRVEDDRFLGVVELLVRQGPPLYAIEDIRRHAGLTPEWPPAGRGLPVGTALSQFAAAHVYLYGLDHAVQRVWRAPGYLRYVDDLFLFADDRATLRALRTRVADWLGCHRGLRLKHPDAPLISCRGTLDGLGYRVRRDEHRARPRTASRLTRRVREVLEGRRRLDLERVVASYMGVLCF